MQEVYAANEGDVYTLGGNEFTVGPKCDDKTARGFWVCTLHQKSFDNQLQKDSHIYDGKHVLAWVCLPHGPEVP
jgi:hypothetical protein